LNKDHIKNKGWIYCFFVGKNKIIDDVLHSITRRIAVLN